MASGVKQTQIATRVDDETLQRIEDRCKLEKRSRAQVLELALDRFLAEPSQAGRIPAGTGEAA